MATIKKAKFFILLFAFLIITALITLRSFSQTEGDWKNVSFATHKRRMKFFDHTTGKIYSYSEVTGELVEVWVLGQLGENLTLAFKKQ